MPHSSTVRPRRRWLSCLARTPRCDRSDCRGPPSVVRFAGLVQRLAPDPVEAELGCPGQHQRAAAAIAIDALEWQRAEHGLSAAGPDRERGELIGALHHGILRGIGTQYLLLARIGARLGDRLEPDRLDLLELD